MRLLVIRHAIAEDRERFQERTGLDDSERPLTAKGKTRMKRAAAALRRYAPVVVLATSPYRRARQTARILAERAGFPEAVALDALMPDGSPDDILDWLRRQPADRASATSDTTADRTSMAERDSTVAIVGHEPDLSRLVGWCVTGRHGSLGPLKKGGVCSLRFADTVAAGKARLEWWAEPGQLRRLGRR